MSSLFVRASEVQPESVKWLWRKRVPLSALTIFEGDPGVGKSTTLYSLAARVSAGCEMPDGTGAAEPGGVLICSAEDSAATIRSSLEVHGADLDRIGIYDKTAAGAARLTLPRDLDKLEIEIGRLKARLAIFDPFASFAQGSLNVETSARAALSPLAALAERNDVAVVLVRHLGKSGGRSALYRGSGSIALIAAARSGILVAKDPGNEQLRVVAQFKSSWGELSNSLSFQLVGESDGKRLDWLGPSGYSAAQLLAASDATESSALSEACYVLFSLLGEGPLWADEAKRLALKAGVNERTLRRARKLLLVQTQRVGFGKGSRFFWSRPPESDLLRHLRGLDLGELADALFNGEPELPAETPTNDVCGFLQTSVDADAAVDDDDDSADWWKRTDENQNGGDEETN
jgi:AAA domain-containing protein